MNIDPITVEVIGSALSSIVEEMGEALIRASYSTNIKERQDYSSAVLADRNALHVRPLLEFRHSRDCSPCPFAASTRRGDPS